LTGIDDASSWPAHRIVLRVEWTDGYVPKMVANEHRTAGDSVDALFQEVKRQIAENGWT
jgi:hypothetical protein